MESGKKGLPGGRNSTCRYMKVGTQPRGLRARGAAHRALERGGWGLSCSVVYTLGHLC